ncbi:hypothetical protein HNP82_000746 [Catenibacillus scindens]|uniref:FAD-dependent oxidoreductase n=1 Tax=Catenibacillus scindens TaxID=673271 RepID=A0A7W8M408_9FIRM|nr:FAD-dependent monooxygenase [Catenibacillus scindens]MBB5263648.1 hypothetical protein [Catenibacillus scindens]
MIRISQIKTDYRSDTSGLLKAAAKKLRISPGQILSMKIVRKSLDARKGQIHNVYTVDVAVDKEPLLLKKFSQNGTISKAADVVYRFPKWGKETLFHPPVIVGSGPAGLFCGLMLARHGYRPVILERGSDVHTRSRKVNAFWEKGILDPQCNVQFGEGGAGTFSDGKLNTLVKDKYGRNRLVLEIFHEAGAPEEILYLNKPHLGTDVLINIVEHMRNEIISLGGKVYFDSQVTDIYIEDSHIKAVEINGSRQIPAQCLVLAIGHSARDTFSMLLDKQINMSAKAFAVGLRIEHPQSMIDQAQYGRGQDQWLKAADYKLTHTCVNGRSVYTFCMCPGGYVVNASSEPQSTAVNGMSYSGRGSANANSAVIVTVTPEDFKGEGPLSGVEFARKLEQAAYAQAKKAGGEGLVPVQQFGDFCDGIPSTEYGQVRPVHKGGCVLTDLSRCLPDFICESLKEGIHAFGEKIPGFDRQDALLSGVESRTSSPVRIERDESFESSLPGIYPCGEGAGYAGGITSAAMDGIKVAEAIARRYQIPEKSPADKT